MANLICVWCKVEYPRDPERKIQPLLCLNCKAERDAEQTALHEARVKSGAEDVRRKTWQAKLFDEHRNGRHKSRVYGCEPCSIRRAVDAVTLPDTDEIPRALR